MLQPPGPQPGLHLPRGLAPFGYRNFALYWMGQAGSSTGTWMEHTAAAWVLYQLTNSPFLLGLMGVFRAVPFLLISPLAGAAADRLDQRRVLAVAQCAALLNSLALGLLILFGLAEPWHFYLQGFLQSIISSFDVTARQALFPSLVARDHLPQAVTLNSTAARTSGLVGPAIGGWLIVTVGDAAPFLANAGSYLVLLGMLVLMRDLPAHATAVLKSSLWSDLAQGLRYVRASPLVLGVLQLETAMALLSHNPAIVTIFARDVLQVGADGLGQLLSAIALGAVVANATLVWRGDVYRKGWLLLGAGAVYAVAMLLFALSSSLWLSFGLLFAVGVAHALFSIMRNTVVQLACPPAMRGRVMATQIAVSRGLHPLSELQSGTLVGLFGPATALGLAAAGLGAAVLASARNECLRQFAGMGQHQGSAAVDDRESARAEARDTMVPRVQPHTHP